jgi:hypothetical protein
VLETATPRRRPRLLLVLSVASVGVVLTQLALSPVTRSVGNATYRAVADTFVSAANHDVAHGDSDVLKTDGGRQLRLAYLRFQMESHGSQPIKSITLRVYGEQDASLGVAVHLVDDPWRESTLTFDGRPLSGRMIGHSGAVRRGRWTEIDVTEAVARTVARDGGEASFALANSPYGAASAALAARDREPRRFASRETDHVPELVVVHGTPTSSTTSSSTTSSNPPTTVAPVVTSTLPPTTSPPPRPPHSSITPGTTGSFQFSGYAPLRDRPVKVWYDAPNDLTTAEVLVVMHGQSRTGEDYRNSWIAHARRAGALLLVPEFSEALYPGSDAYNLGNIEREPESRWSFSLIEPLFDHIRADSGNRSDGYYLYGHSAGAQFVHRLLLFKQNRVKGAVAANAGWYTAPEPQVEFPYGLRGSPITDAGLRRALAAPLTVLLGESDTDPNDPDLRHSSGADRQGPHRLARGHFFFAAGRTTAGALGTRFGWTLQTVPGAVHSNGDMAAAAARVLFA